MNIFQILVSKLTDASNCNFMAYAEKKAISEFPALQPTTVSNIVINLHYAAWAC